MTPRFADRQDAGRQLARRLEEYRDRDNLVVLGLARGGVPVAAEIARALEAPLDVLVVRKLGAPGREELAMGALAPEGVEVLNDDVVAALGLSDELIAEVEQREADLLERRRTRFRGGRPPLQLVDRTVLLVDDGLATGASMRASIQFVRSKEPDELAVAAPTGSAQTCASIAAEVDDLVCPYRPFPFFGVSQAYRDFPQLDDETVRRVLRDTPAA
jgi:predicted phosphoribosyltransferase